MTMMHSAGDYPLAKSSRRRRRLVTLAHSLAAAPDLRRPAATALNSERFNIWSGSRTGNVRGDGPVQHEGLRALLASNRSVAWMIAGDDHSASVAGGLPGFCQRFATEFRPARRPAADPIIDVAWPGCRLADIRANLDDWLQHAPDVLLILSGAADATAGLQQLTRFEADAAWIVGKCREAATLPILTTSPLPLLSEADANYVGSLVYAEALRALSAEWDLPLVDFLDEWEQMAIRQGLTGSWIAESGTRPTAIGCMHLVSQVMREIDMHRVAPHQADYTERLPAVPR
jgi:hypothetical protein